MSSYHLFVKALLLSVSKTFRLSKNSVFWASSTAIIVSGVTHVEP